MSRRRKTGSVALFSMVGTPNPASTSHTQLQPSSAHTSARVREASRCYGNLLWAAYIRNLNPNFPTRPFQSPRHLHERIRVLKPQAGDLSLLCKPVPSQGQLDGCNRTHQAATMIQATVSSISCCLLRLATSEKTSDRRESETKVKRKCEEVVKQSASPSDNSERNGIQD